MNIDLTKIGDYKNLFPTCDLQSAGNDDFVLKKSKLPIQVQHFLSTTNINSQKFGKLNYQGENLFWAASTLKLLIFNPETNKCISVSIDEPINTIFTNNFYVILSQENKVTLLRFPPTFAETDSSSSYSNIDLIECQIPSTFEVTSATGEFLGCSDGLIRHFKLIGHPPDTQILISVAAKPKIAQSSILSLEIINGVLYSLDTSMFLLAYKILEDNRLILVDDGLKLPGKFINMQPCDDSVILTKQMNGSFRVATLLNSFNSFSVPKDGLLISKNVRSDTILTDYSHTNSAIYRIQCGSYIPIQAKRIDTNVIQVFLITETARNNNIFQFKVKKGDIVIFMADGFIPTPFSNVENQLFSLQTSQTDKIQFNYKEHDYVKTISTQPTNIEVTEDPSKFRDKKPESYYLRIVSDYSITGPKSSMMTLFGFDTISHSIWGNNGLFCFIHSNRPDYGELVVCRYGYEPVAKYQKISGTINSYLTINDSLLIFTSKEILHFSLNKLKIYKKCWNFISEFVPYWQKRITVSNLKDFQNNIIQKYFDLSPHFEKVNNLINDVLKITTNKDYFDTYERIGSFITKHDEFNSILAFFINDRKPRESASAQPIYLQTERPINVTYTMSPTKQYRATRDTTLAKEFDEAIHDDSNCKGLQKFVDNKETSNEYPHAINMFSMWTANLIVDNYFSEHQNTEKIENLSNFRMNLFNEMSESQLYE